VEDGGGKTAGRRGENLRKGFSALFIFVLASLALHFNFS
jgi:hypothetical protein